MPRRLTITWTPHRDTPSAARHIIVYFVRDEKRYTFGRQGDGTFETLTLRTGGANDTFQINSLPAAPRTTTLDDGGGTGETLNFSGYTAGAELSDTNFTPEFSGLISSTCRPGLISPSLNRPSSPVMVQRVVPTTHTVTARAG